jgi:hypothetical protein
MLQARRGSNRLFCLSACFFALNAEESPEIVSQLGVVAVSAACWPETYWLRFALNQFESERYNQQIPFAGRQNQSHLHLRLFFDSEAKLLLRGEWL